MWNPADEIFQTFWKVYQVADVILVGTGTSCWKVWTLQTSGLICVLGSSHKLCISYKPLCSESGIFSDSPSVSGALRVVREGSDGREVCFMAYLERNLSCYVYDNSSKWYFFFMYWQQIQVKVKIFSYFFFLLSLPLPSLLVLLILLFLFSSLSSFSSLYLKAQLCNLINSHSQSQLVEGILYQSVTCWALASCAHMKDKGSFMLPSFRIDTMNIHLLI